MFKCLLRIIMVVCNLNGELNNKISNKDKTIISTISMENELLESTKLIEYCILQIKSMKKLIVKKVKRKAGI
jgi:hypothetical protein